MKKAIPYGRQHVTQSDIDAVIETMQSDYLTTGPKVGEFEERFAAYVGSKYAVAVANGTAALHLCAMALNVKPGDKVITSPITFAASANCVRYCGGEVVFSDIDEATILLDIEKVRRLLEAAPRGTYQGMIPVDFAGYPVDMEAFRKLADEYGLWIIEDACHAPGGYFFDSVGQIQRCGNGNFADLAIFSFHPVKHIACGEGGMITTSDRKLYERLLVLRTHGITRNPEQMQENHGGWYYEMIELGYNYRMPDILCAMGISQLQRANENMKRRHAIAQRYNHAFTPHSHIRPYLPSDDVFHAYHLYIVAIQHRKELYDALRVEGIYAQVHYIPVHTLPYYQELGYQKGDFPLAENYYEYCLSLPMYPSLTDEEQDFVIERVLQFFQ
ncbi:MAG: UDP-4-amino-4,6-dideoxy-N-acetyl-beta-L-altrosamine transaminase [Saprospiraceae bacterium]|nr:UDP-4-amino-4,6-dideoxy-N-acetyl-beta-L-altrosamine transaminase [Saprospiraceae bacterium]